MHIIIAILGDVIIVLGKMKLHVLGVYNHSFKFCGCPDTPATPTVISPML